MGKNAFNTLWAFTVSAGKWDRFTSWGPKVKGGSETVFNEETCGQIIDNFANRKNDLAMDYDHQAMYSSQNGQPAPALAFYSALMLVVDGEIVRLATHDKGVIPPFVSDFENGIYGYRSEITPMGEKLLPNYKYISPLFVTDGKDELGNDIGYDLVDVAATNIPFQDDVAITFHTGASSARKASIMNAQLMKKLGLADDASAEDQEKAVEKMAADIEDMKKKKMDKGEEVAEGEGDEGEDDEEKKKKKAAEKEAMASMRKDLGLHGDAGATAIYAAMSAKLVPQQEVIAMRDRLEALEKLEADRKAADEDAKLEAFASDAIKSGQWNKEKKPQLIRLAKADFDAAKDALLEPGTFTVLQRITSGGQPIGTPRKSTAVEDQPEGGSIVLGNEFASEARKYAKENKVSLMEAQSQVAKSNPDLFQAYSRGE